MTQLPPASYPPPAAPVRTNGLGVAGFIVSLLGFITCGILWPVGLLLSFFALFRRPRGVAFAGFVVGLVGTALLALVIGLFGFAIFGMAGWARHGVMPAINTIKAMLETQRDVQAYRVAHAGALPDDLQGNLITAGKLDGWNHPLVYQKTGPGGYELRSAGPDGIIGTGDDEAEFFSASTP